MERISASYLVETPLPLERAADVLAGEQSTGTFVKLPGETECLREAHSARVDAVLPIESTDCPSLPGSRPHATRYHRAQITVSWPAANVGENLPALISTLQGNLYELAQFSGLRLLDFELPDSFQIGFTGPTNGIRGTRKYCANFDSPLIGNIIKPSVGLSPEHTGALVTTLAQAGVDFIKDDELMTNPPSSPFRERVRTVMKAINAHADKTGKRVMYAFNISDDSETMFRNYDWIQQNGGTCAMVSVNAIGLSATRAICQHGELAIHGHRNGWGMLNRHPMLGMDFAAYDKIWRLAGVDQLHVNGIDNKFWEPDDSVVHSIECCKRSFLNQPEKPLPVVSSGQWGGQAFETYKRVGTIDLLYMAGGGIMAHPGGPAAGVRAIRQAWNGAVAGMSLHETATQHEEFRMAVQTFGKSL